MSARNPDFVVRAAATDADRQAAFRLRYRVFVEEMGGDGPGVDHVRRLEQDDFDAHAGQLLLIDRNRPGGGEVVGLYRMMDAAGAAAGPGFYCDGEFDLAPLRASGRRLLELGRSCLAAEYRGGTAMYHLWQGLAAHVRATGVELLFGVASFPGSDAGALAAPLSLLHHLHLAPPELRVRSRAFQRMDLLPLEAIDRRAAMLVTPPLIKAYLRLGGVVGEGAFIDRAFNTTDVCMVLDTARMTPRARAIYAGPAPQ